MPQASSGCVMIGHDDGGTIALEFAATQPPLLRAVVTIGAHVISEARTLSSIRHARDAFLQDRPSRAAGDISR